MQGHKEVLKISVLHNISVARQHEFRSIVAIDSIVGFRIFSTNVTQAYLQSAEKLHREIFIKPIAEFDLRRDELLKLLKLPYELSESKHYWGRTFRDHLEDKHRMQCIIQIDALFDVQKPKTDECLDSLLGSVTERRSIHTVDKKR